MPENLMIFLVVTLWMHISVLNSTPLKLSLLPQPPFSWHPRRFISPNSALSHEELLQKISLSLRGVRPNPTNTPPGSAAHDLLSITRPSNLQAHKRVLAFHQCRFGTKLTANRLHSRVKRNVSFATQISSSAPRCTLFQNVYYTAVIYTVKYIQGGYALRINFFWLPP